MPKKFTEEFKKDAVALVAAGSSQHYVHDHDLTDSRITRTRYTLPGT